jgi:hypothetical protein
MKVYSEIYMGGKIKYVVNFHNGVKTHKDGSRFFDIAIFKNKIKKANFIKELLKDGYIYDGI